MGRECESSGGPSRLRSEDSFLLARTVGSSGGMAEAGSSPLTEEEERNHGPQHTIFPGAGAAAAVQRALPTGPRGWQPAPPGAAGVKLTHGPGVATGREQSYVEARRPTRQPVGRARTLLSRRQGHRGLHRSSVAAVGGRKHRSSCSPGTNGSRTGRVLRMTRSEVTD